MMRQKHTVSRFFSIFVFLFALSVTVTSLSDIGVYAGVGDPPPSVAIDTVVPAIAEVGVPVTINGRLASDYGGIAGLEYQLNGTDGTWNTCSVSSMINAGERDYSFDSGNGSGAGADSDVWAIAIQGDGKVLIGGAFTSYNGTPINRIARLNTDGTLDGTFNVGTGANSTVLSIAIQVDGKILIGGWFTSYKGTPINRIARLNTDGTLDGTFTVGTGAGSTVYSIAIQGDGKILIAGQFTSYNGTPINGIARLNTDGTLDGTFNVGTGANDVVGSIAIQGDGKVLIGGTCIMYNGSGVNGLLRIYEAYGASFSCNVLTGEAVAGVNTIYFRSSDIDGNMTTGDFASTTFERILGEEDDLEATGQEALISTVIGISAIILSSSFLRLYRKAVKAQKTVVNILGENSIY